MANCMTPNYKSSAWYSYFRSFFFVRLIGDLFVSSCSRSLLLIKCTHKAAHMPSRKEKHKIHFKPIDHNVHSSLSSRSNTPHTSSSNTSQEVLPESVTARIEHLRRTQAPVVSSAEEVAQRLRPNLLTSRRRVAGPPPPKSWVEGDVEAKLTLKYGAGGATQPGEMVRRPQTLDYFPDLNLGHAMSLQCIVLKALAREFDWHAEYDHAYLSTLPVKLKMLLLSYIASYGPEEGMSSTGLRLLMMSPIEVDNSDVDIAATGSAELTRLDLGGSVGRGSSLRQLDRMWHIKARRKEASSPIESWDMEESLPPTITSSLRFPVLTHLSLAYPGPATSWSDLLHFSRHLGALTHLSLVFWPAPTVPSTASSASKIGNPASNPTTTGSRHELNSNSDDSSISEANHILRLLSRATPSLTYLSLDGCQDWWQALRYNPSPTTVPIRPIHRQASYAFFDLPIPSTSKSAVHPSSHESIWTASWRHITTLSLSQCWIPKDVDTHFLFQLYGLRGRTLASDNTSNAPPHPIPLRPPHESTALPHPGAAALAPREFPTPASRSGLGMQASQHAPSGEAYTIHASPTIAQSILARTQRQQWCKYEIEALQVENHIRSVRRSTKKGEMRLEILHGWSRVELLETGYLEGMLWQSGFG